MSFNRGSLSGKVFSLALWSRTTRIHDVSTGPLACLYAQCIFVHTTRSLTRSALLTLLARSTALICLLAHSLPSLWENESFDVICSDIMIFWTIKKKRWSDDKIPPFVLLLNIIFFRCCHACYDGRTGIPSYAVKYQKLWQKTDSIGSYLAILDRQTEHKSTAISHS